MGQLLKHWGTWLYLACTLGMPGVAIAESPRPEVAQIDYCIALQAPESLNELDSCAWVDRSSVTLASMLAPNRWVRIRFDNDTFHRAEAPLKAIRISPHFIPSITFYHSEPTGNAWVSATTGSNYPGNNPNSVIGGYVFTVDPQHNGSTVYLKFDHYSLGYIGLSITNLPDPALLSQFGIGLHLGALLLILLIAIGSYAIERNSLTLSFCFYVGIAALGVLMGSGTLAHYVYPEHPKLGQTLFTIAASLRLMLWCLISRSFLRAYTVPSWYQAMYAVLLLLCAVCMIMAITNQMTWIFFLIVLGSIVFSVAQYIVIRQTTSMPERLRQILMAGYLTVTAIVAAVAVTAAAPGLPAQIPLYLTRLSDFLPVLILAGMLAYQRRNLHAELTSTQNDLAALNLKAMYATQLNEERRTMVDMLTHELKNPLTTMSVAAASLSEQVGSTHPDAPRRFEKIQHAIHNMDQVIERCSLANAIDETSLSPKLSEINMATLLQHLVDSCNEPERVVLINNIATEIISSDREHLRIIFNNLIDNACKYGVPGSPIHVSLSDTHPGDKIVVKISNALAAGNHPDLDSLFTRYYRHPMAHQTSGSGLGLFLVRGLCNGLGGSISARIELNMISFQVVLPR